MPEGLGEQFEVGVEALDVDWVGCSSSLPPCMAVGLGTGTGQDACSLRVGLSSTDVSVERPCSSDSELSDTVGSLGRALTGGTTSVEVAKHSGQSTGESTT